VKTNAISSGNYTANFTYRDTGCVGKAISFINTSMPSSLLDSSRWSFGDGKTSTSVNASNVYNAIGNYNIKLVAWFDKCSDTIVKPITILPQPVANFTASSTGSCNPPLTVNFNNMTSGGTVVRWDFGNGQTSNLANPSITYDSPGKYDVSLIVKNANGCMDTLVNKEFINISHPEVTAIDGLPYTGCMPFSNTFGVTVNSPEPIITYSWDFGDGTVSTLKNPKHNFSDTSLYNVTVVVTTSSGCIDTFSNIVHGGIRPVSKFKGGPNFICPEMPVNFQSLSSGIANGWFWKFGDGGVSDLENPVYLYKDTGWMTVTLVAYNNGCADTAIIPNYIYVNPPIPRFIETFLCTDPFTITFTDNSKGGEKWNWYIDATDSAIGKIYTYTFPDTGLYKVKLVVQDSSCINQAIHDVQIINEKAAFVTTDSAICGVSYKRFIASGPQTHPEYIVSYEWNFGDGVSVTTDTSVTDHVYKANGTYKVQLIITDIKGCRDTVIVPLNIQRYGPTADFTPPISNICAGTLLTFYDSTYSVNPLVKWEWDFGNGIDSVFTGSPFTTVYKTPGVFDVKMTVTDSAGCRGSILKRKAVYVFQPVAGFFSPDTIICAHSPAAFTNLSTGAGLQYSWKFGDGKTSNQVNPVNTYDTLGKYDVSLFVKDSLNCVDSLFRPKYISVEQTIAAFSISDSFTTCPPLVVNFTNFSKNSFDNKWTFGNGNSSSLVSPSHTYTTPGFFTAKLIATGNGGCADSVTKNIRIQGPYGTFSYGPLGGCPPLKVFFAGQPVNTTSITWDFSDGESVVTSDTTAVHDYLVPGFYVPKAILADNLGCKIAIQGIDTIKVIGAKAYIQSIPHPEYCDSVTIQFFDSTVTMDVVKRYDWNFGDGSKSNSRNPIHTYNKPGKYMVTFEVETATGCISRDTLPQPVIISPTPRFVIGKDSAVCVPVTIQYYAAWTNRDTSTINWKWNFGNGQSSSKLIPDPVLYNNSGKFNVSLTGSNYYGCSDTVVKLVQVNDTPRVTAGPASYLCLGDAVTLNVTGGLTYKWDPSPSLSCTDCTNPVASPVISQIYRAVATDSNGCKSSDTVWIRVKSPGKLLVGPGDTLCVGQSLTLNASGMELYKWTPAAGLSSTTIANPVAKPVVTTVYQVAGNDSLNCFPDTGYVTIVVFPVPQFNILETNISGLPGTQLPVATTSSADITSWHWTPPVGLSCTNCPEPVLTVETSITYTAIARNDGFCKAEDKITVTPICDQNSVFIPNTFSPNGDGKNDVFYPRGRGASLVKSMRIFNRWGELLYDRKDFALNDPGAGWDGIYNGAKLTPDVYVYLIDVVCDSKVVFNLKGNVTLLR
jgi:gliding motility-associated-like protein